MRWAVLAAFIYAAVVGVRGWQNPRAFTKRDARVVSSAVGLAHLQLLLGFILYELSPIVDYFWKNKSEGMTDIQLFFFPVVHLTLACGAVILVTIGGALVKRAETDAQKFRTTAFYFVSALVLILCAIPWPVVSWVNRPFWRGF